MGGWWVDGWVSLGWLCIFGCWLAWPPSSASSVSMYCWESHSLRHRGLRTTEVSAALNTSSPLSSELIRKHWCLPVSKARHAMAQWPRHQRQHHLWRWRMQRRRVNLHSAALPHVPHRSVRLRLTPLLAPAPAPTAGSQPARRHPISCQSCPSDLPPLRSLAARRCLHDACCCCKASRQANCKPHENVDRGARLHLMAVTLHLRMVPQIDRQGELRRPALDADAKRLQRSPASTWCTRFLHSDFH